MPLRQRNSRGSSLFEAPDLRVILHPNFRLCVDVAMHCDAELLCGLPALREEDVQKKVEVSRKLCVLQLTVLANWRTSSLNCVRSESSSQHKRLSKNRLCNHDVR
jgi:hypothetical protein